MSDMRDTNSYAAVHLRLGRRRGPARTNPCTDCDQPAAVWSWNRTGPQRTGNDSHGAVVTWGLDIADYSPRCRSHAQIMDHGGTLTRYPCGHPRTPTNTKQGGCRECYRVNHRVKQRLRRERKNQPWTC